MNVSDEQVKAIKDAVRDARIDDLDVATRDAVNATCEAIIRELREMKKRTPLDSYKNAFQMAIAKVKGFKYD